MTSPSTKGSTEAGFNVSIVAAGPLRSGGLVYAIAVTQPVQSWTVLRNHENFKLVADSLSKFLTGLPSCPPRVHQDFQDVNVIVDSRNELQQWLVEVLMYPGARESPDFRNFLTTEANMIPPQLEAVSWVNFSQHDNTSETANTGSRLSTNDATNLDDMEMDDMFEDDDGNVIAEEEDDDEEDFIPASVRYKPTDEAISNEEEMEIMALASEVEMVEDIGSLAQSLGASHLGQSLKLQAEMANRKMPQTSSQEDREYGVTIHSPGPKKKDGQVGGLSNAMEQAKGQFVQGLGDSFNTKAPVSAPRLDSFKMIRVIGKGSFGEFCN
eukprot:CAMPEP_0178937840 /NCGR_PEP_ID=MMETSP0786-20121207/25992_1 /TAXON_ID=186022 /ORGANISM="Thalassionema frauenfeldii, Strain CCMP 1798" /LENGTH=324 /DNA_ID=CAMNT_0020616479 /DNA_START=265 /DNA_END=1239 /DNA_ORIENTATION=+